MVRSRDKPSHAESDGESDEKILVHSFSLDIRFVWNDPSG